MNTTLSGTTPRAAGGPNICFNPYLEEVFPGGTVSNCIRCHSHAVYVREDQLSKTLEGYTLGLDRGTSSDPSGKYFENALQTDFMWSIPEVHDTQLQDLLENLRKRLRLLKRQQ